MKLVKQNNGFSRKINPKLYEKYSWLCGSRITNKLYCWPCLLFSKKEISVWNSAQCGYDDLNNLHIAVGRHDKTASHLTALLAHNTFGQIGINLLLDNQKCIAITKHTIFCRVCPNNCKKNFLSILPQMCAIVSNIMPFFVFCFLIFVQFIS